MTPREKTDLRNRISEEATKRFWGREVHYLASSVADVIDSMPETEITTEQAWNKIAEGYPKSAEAIANTCDTVLNVMNCGGNIGIKNGKLVTANFEKEVEVPSFIGRYIEKLKVEKGRDLQWAVCDILNDLHDKEFDDWFATRSNFEVFTEAWNNGFVIKEQLYIMPVPYAVGDAYRYVIDEGEKIRITTYDEDNTEFTEAEINEYFPKIAEFKEEVAE